MASDEALLAEFKLTIVVCWKCLEMVWLERLLHIVLAL